MSEGWAHLTPPLPELFFQQAVSSGCTPQITDNTPCHFDAPHAAAPQEQARQLASAHIFPLTGSFLPQSVGFWVTLQGCLFTSVNASVRVLLTGARCYPWLNSCPLPQAFGVSLTSLCSRACREAQAGAAGLQEG